VSASVHATLRTFRLARLLPVEELDEVRDGRATRDDVLTQLRG
jgi:hypothetical protein